uniref:(California timema) hypothetical protein n=1 Tax=Timema californicum TaxID=61474 RepID=A0A7R9PDH2_TIMCA|nr:unnamed protein product [Timema californicum]
MDMIHVQHSYHVILTASSRGTGLGGKLVQLVSSQLQLIAADKSWKLTTLSQQNKRCGCILSIPLSWCRKSMWQTDASGSHSVATMLPSHCHVLLILLGISHDTGSRLARESEGRVGRRQWRARKDGGANTTESTAQVDSVPERFDLNKEVSPVMDGEGNFVGQAISLLQRLNERLTALQALDEQQIRRLESLEYRYSFPAVTSCST